MGTLELKLFYRKYNINLDTRDLTLKTTMSMFLLFCVACSIVTSNGNLQRDIELSEMVASLTASPNLANFALVDLDAISNVGNLKQNLLQCCCTQGGCRMLNCC